MFVGDGKGEPDRPARDALRRRSGCLEGRDGAALSHAVSRFGKIEARLVLTFQSLVPLLHLQHRLVVVVVAQWPSIGGPSSVSIPRV